MDDSMKDGITGLLAIATMLLIILLLLQVQSDIYEKDFYRFCLEKSISLDDCVIPQEKTKG